MSYQALELSGAGWGQILDAAQDGLDMGLSDFMLGMKIRTSSVAKQPLIYKSGVGGYYDWHINAVTGFLHCIIDDGVNTVNITGDVRVTDGRWHTVRVSIDKSSATGGRLYVGGAEDVSARANVTTVGDIDNNGIFYIGYDGVDFFTGWMDCVRVWNFGFGGLPADVAAYDTWRAAGRNCFLDISNYSAGAWNGYADAYRIERITYLALDDDNGDFEGAGPDGTDIEIGNVTDWEKINTSAEIDDEAGSGVNTYNGSTFCCKIHTATGVNSQIILYNLEPGVVDGEYYELSYDYKVLNCTNAKFRVYSAGGTDIYYNLISIAWTTARYTFQLSADTDVRFYVYSHLGAGQSGNEVVWIDNISIREIGNVAEYEFTGNLLDETTNSNDLTAGGVGNTFPGYTLRKKRIFAPSWAR